jgi:tRNA threonylcarbamoyl adenosine modification protein YeaZ
MSDLCFSVSESITSIAVSWEKNEDQIVFDRKNSGALLIEKIDALLSAHHIAREDIARIGVNIGPGSFTGIRVAVATANGLGLGLRVPVAGFSSLDLIAEEWVLKNKKPAGKIVSAVNAERKQFFAAFYEIQNGIVKKIGPDTLWDKEDFIQASRTLPVAGWRLEAAGIPFEAIYPGALSCVRMLQRTAKLAFPSFASPNYIRATDAEIKIVENKIKN